MTNIIGISSYFHDSACCLLQNGSVRAAVQEERFSRRKHDHSLPVRSFQWCLREAGLTIADIECVAYYEDPQQKLARQIWQLGPQLTYSRALQLWVRSRQPIDDIRRVLGFAGDIEVVTHHKAHAASAFFFSGFSEAAILTVDGVGEWATTTYSHANGIAIQTFEEVEFPHSLGLLYSTLTSYLGFEVNDGEYKLMGLASYGRPRYINKLREFIQSEPFGQFRLQSNYFDFKHETRMHSEMLVRTFDRKPRLKTEPILAFHQDLASSVQLLIEEILLEKTRYLHGRVPVENLCLAGGVALNCVAISRLIREGPYKRVFIQPAAGDAGGSIGAAALANARRHGSRSHKALDHVYLGPSYPMEEIACLLRDLGINAMDFQTEESNLIEATVALLKAGKVIGWFQGRMEFGPRALGARSILADPRIPGMRDHINHLVKKREEFRPFAPAVLEHLAMEHFILDHPSPFMLETCQVISPLSLPAITHVDGSARVQTVSARTNPRFAKLLEAFYRGTECPILLNTSFNLSDEPIVATPSDAMFSFCRSELDALVMGDFIVLREGLNSSLIGRCRAVREQPKALNDRVYTFW